MNFVSLNFILFLIATIFVYYVIPKKFRFIVLLIANTFFYFFSCGWNFIYLFISIFSVYMAGLGINKNKNKKRLILICTIALNLLLLAFLKENNYLIGLFNKLINSSINVLDIVVPLGISYYTLVAISYIVDIYLGKTKPITNFFKLYLSMTFFPLMIEGPIVKINEVADSLYEGQKFDYNNLKYGYLRILWGFAKKLIIADRVSLVVDKVFDGSYGGLTIIIAMILYVIQIYTEFSGCMDIVIGIGRIFNIKLPENFNAPFFSKDISEFWRRWHITLGRWLKDYIFFPLSMTKMNMKINLKTHKKMPRFLADLLTSLIPLLGVWLLMGIWHGYGIKYIVYGLYWFALIITGMVLRPLFQLLLNKFKMKTDCFSFHLFQSIKTFILVTIGLTLFRASSLNNFVSILSSIINDTSGNVTKLIGGSSQITIIIIGIILVLLIDIFKYRGVIIDEWLEKQNLVFRYIVFLSVLFFVLIFGMYGYGYDPASFIYGGF